MLYIIYNWDHTCELTTVLRSKYKWWGNSDWHRTWLLLFQGSKSAQFSAVVLKQKWFSADGFGRTEITGLSHTKLICIHWDLRLFENYLARKFIWTFLTTWKIIQWLLNNFLIVFLASRCLFIHHISCTDILAENSVSGGQNMILHMLWSWSSMWVLFVW